MTQANGKLAYIISKMVQAIFLPGAWGKIPVFMGKNHPTPRAARAFLHAQNYPLKPDFFRRGKNFLKNIFTFATCECILESQPTKNGG